MTLAEFLRNKRTRMRQTQNQAAACVGVRPESWRNWERGGEPGAGKLPAIADWAGVTLNRLRPFLELLDEARKKAKPVFPR